MQLRNEIVGYKDDHARQDRLVKQIQNIKLRIIEISRTKTIEEFETVLAMPARDFDLELEKGLETLTKRRRSFDKTQPRLSRFRSINDVNEKLDREYAIKFLIKRQVLHKDKKVREAQLKSLDSWGKYLANNYDDLGFIYFVMRSLLKYDIHWENRQSKNTTKVFPTFDTYSPGVLAQIYDIFKFHTNETDTVGDIVARVINGSRVLAGNVTLIQAAESGDFKTMYQVLRRRAQIEKQKREGLESVEGTGSWVQIVVENGVKKVRSKFSFKDEKGNELSKEDKEKEATRLAELGMNSDNFCFKGVGTAYSYLQTGDIYIYTVKKKGQVEVGTDENGEKVFEDFLLDVPEIAFHVFHDGNINMKEIHGNAENQGITSEYVRVFAEFIEGRFKNSNEITEQRLLDAQMYDVVKKKLKKGLDLSREELLFIFEVYRKAEEPFDLNPSGSLLVPSLTLRWFENYCKKNTLKVDYENASKYGYMELFGIKDSEYLPALQYKNSYHLGYPEGIGGGIRMVSGDLETFEIEGSRKNEQKKYDFSSLEYVTGSVSLFATNLPKLKEIFGVFRCVTDGGGVVKRENFPNLEKIHGIALTKKDKENIFSGSIKYFPPKNDPRVEKRRYSPYYP